MGQKELSIHFQEMGELTDELQEIAEEIKNLIQGKGEVIGFLHTYKISKNDINRIYRLNKLTSKQSMNPDEILNNLPGNNQSHY